MRTVKNFLVEVGVFGLYWLFPEGARWLHVAREGI